MKIFIKAFVVAILSLLLVQTIYADETEHYKLAEALINVNETSVLQDAAIEGLVFNVVLQEPQLIFYVDVLREFYSSLYKREDLKNDFITIYTNHFTEEELKIIVDFQKTPAGQKFIQEIPEVTMQLAKAFGDKKVELSPELNKMIADKSNKIQSLKNKPVFTVPELFGKWSITWVNHKSTNQAIIFSKGSTIEGTYVNDSEETCKMLGVVNNAGNAVFNINCPSWTVSMQGDLSNDNQIIQGYSLVGTIIERFIMRRNE